MPLEGSFTPVSGTSATSATPAPTVISDLGSAVAPPDVVPVAPAPVVEKPPETPVPTRPPEVESWRLAALSQKEKAARESAAAAKADREAAAKDRAEVENFRQQFAQREAGYRQDPMKLLTDFGYDYNTVTQFVAQGGWSPEQQQAAREAARDQAIRTLAQQQQADRQAIQAQREADAKAQTDAQAQAQAEAQTNAVAEFKGELKSFVDAEPDTYEMIRLAGPNALEAVFDKISDHFEKTQTRLSNKDAADAVEAALVAEAEKVIEASKKLKSKFAPPAPVRAPVSRTLDNGMRPPPTGAKPVASEAETEAQRRARVVANINKAWGHG
jgi:translation initiation factor IF-2